MPEISFPSATDTPPRTDYTTTPWIDPVNGGKWIWTESLSAWNPRQTEVFEQIALDVGIDPNTLTITGITTPANRDPLVLTMGGLTHDADGNITQNWHAGEPGSNDLSVYVSSIFGVWSITIGTSFSYTYEAIKISSAKTPVGLTDWTIITGAGQPILEGNDKFPSYVGQLGTSYPGSAFGVVGPPWFRWNGHRWQEDVGAPLRLSYTPVSDQLFIAAGLTSNIPTSIPALTLRLGNPTFNKNWSGRASGVTYIMNHESDGSWRFESQDYPTSYKARSVSTTDESPIDVTAWTVLSGTGQPVITGTVANPPIDILGRTAIVDVGGVVSQWSAVSWGEWMEITNTSIAVAATVTTNANLTGHVTSVGNATSLGSFTLAQLNTAISDADIPSTAAALAFSPSGTLVATNVQAALAELDADNLSPALNAAISTPVGRMLLTLPSLAAASVQLGITASLDAQSHTFAKQSFGFYNTTPGKQRTGYQERKSQSTIDLTVTGGALAIGTITQGAGSYVGARSILVEEAGYPPVTVSGTVDDTVQTANLTLNSNPATVRITEGLTGTGAPGNADSIEKGTRVVTLSATTLAKVLPVSLPTHRLVMVGDSITIGDNGGTAGGDPLRDSALATLRRCGVWETAPVGRGYAGWKDWADEPRKLVEQIIFAADASDTNVIWIALGTNDYGINLQIPSAVQTQVAVVLKMIRKALPNAIIYVQTPLIRSTETANALGYTLATYRTAISSGVTDSGVTATTVNGSTMLTVGDLQDGVHPSSLGHVKWAIAVQAAITQTVIPAKYTAGVFSNANYFSTAAGAGQADLGNSKTLLICWYQNAASTGGRVLAGYWEGLYGAVGSSGWLLYADTSSNTINFLARPSSFTVCAASTSVGWHCLALTYTTVSDIRYSLDGGTVVNAALSPYVNGSALARIGIGLDPIAVGAAAATEEINGVAVLDYKFTDAELVAASKFGQSRGSMTLARRATSGAKVLWTAENYNPASATQQTLGKFPLTLTRNGSIARNLK